MKSIAFDFSISKPACCFYDNGKYEFYVWPMNVGERTEAALASAGVHVRNRKLEHIESKKFTVTELERIHLERAAQLGGMILEDVSRLITPDEMIGTEGLSFASKGNQYLNLVEYRSIMFSILFGAGYRNVYTYSPITIKGVAGCSKKSEMGKASMIDAFRSEPLDNEFHRTLLMEGTPLIKKTQYVECVDDIVDSYWCMKTMFLKERIS